MQKKTLSEAQDQPIIDSVFDFIYHDGRRVASFLAQFEPSGNLTQVSKGKHIEQVRGDTQKLEGSASIPGIAKAIMASSDEVKSRQQDDMMRVYDPMWSNARALLDLLDERGMIQRDITAARLGQMVLISGALDIYDLKIMSGIWQLPTIKKLMAAGVPKGPEVSKAQSGTARGKALKDASDAIAKTARANIELMSELVPALPHTSHGTINTDQRQQLWFNFDPAGLSYPTSEVMLKHGIAVPGHWSLLGILDAFPEPIEVRSRKHTPNGDEAIAKIFEAIAPVVRTMFGRPEASFGVTPLMIFRETVAPTS